MKSKCEAIFKNIIMESIENSPVRYKAYGFWQLAPDDYENGEGEIVKSGVFDDYFGKTAVEAIKRLVTNEGIELTGGFEVVDINGKTYAKTIFLIGLENENYQENLAFTEEIKNLMNTKYPGLSKGIYKKGGEGVNGVYNQDFSNRTILIEIGGYENTPSEVLNSVLAFSECFMEVIEKDER